LEHSWGRAVQETGLVGVGATLAARFLVNPLIVLTNAPAPNLLNNVQLWFTRADTLAGYSRSELGIGGMHFPYGLDDLVEPDVPL